MENKKNEGNETANDVKKLVLERESYISKKNGKTYFNYIVNGTLRGQKIRVDFNPKIKRQKDDVSFGDFKMNSVLDLVFGETNAVDLIVTEDFFTNEKTGEVMPYATYLARSEDAEGVYECDVVPVRASDKALLKNLLNKKPIAKD